MWTLQCRICAPGLISQGGMSHTYSVSSIIISFSGSSHPCDSCKMKLAIVYGISSGLLCQLIYWGSHCEITWAVTPQCEAWHLYHTCHSAALISAPLLLKYTCPVFTSRYLFYKCLDTHICPAWRSITLPL